MISTYWNGIRNTNYVLENELTAASAKIKYRVDFSWSVKQYWSFENIYIQRTSTSVRYVLALASYTFAFRQHSKHRYFLPPTLKIPQFAVSTCIEPLIIAWQELHNIRHGTWNWNTCLQKNRNRSHIPLRSHPLILLCNVVHIYRVTG